MGIQKKLNELEGLLRSHTTENYNISVCLNKVDAIRSELEAGAKSAVQPVVICDPTIFEIALNATKPKMVNKHSDSVKWHEDAIKMIRECQDGHYGDECELCRSR